jgi:hypothetical protein
MGRGKRGKKTKKTGRGEGSRKRTEQRKRKREKTFFSFNKKRRVAASKSRGLNQFSARGEPTAQCIFPTDSKFLATSWSGVERQRELENGAKR